MDSEIPEDSTDWYDPSDVENPGFFDYPFDKTGTYRYCEVQYTEKLCNIDYELFEDANDIINKEDIFYDCQEVVCEDYQGNPSQLGNPDPWDTI